MGVYRSIKRLLKARTNQADNLIAELKAGNFKQVTAGAGDWVAVTVFRTVGGRKISVVEGMSTTVRVNDIETGWLYKHRILRAMKQGVKKL